MHIPPGLSGDIDQVGERTAPIVMALVKGPPRSIGHQQRAPVCI